MEAAISRFIEEMGLRTEAEGLARTAGRLFAYLVVNGGPCSADELASELEVSRGNVSMSTRLLESRGLIERVSRCGEQKIFYRIAEDPYRNLVQWHLERRRRIREVVRTTLEGLQEAGEEELPAGARERLDMLRGFYDLVIRRMEEGLEQWQARAGRDRPPETTTGEEEPGTVTSHQTREG